MQSQSANSLEFIPNGLLYSNVSGPGDHVIDSGEIPSQRVTDWVNEENKIATDGDEEMESGSEYYSADEVKMAVHAHSSTFEMAVPDSTRDDSVKTPKASVSEPERRT